MKADVKEYWNNVERAIDNLAPGRIVDNFVKRRLLIGALSKYELHGKDIIELGTGLGLTAYVVGLMNGRIRYSGVDISDTFAKSAKSKFGLNVVVADMTDGLPFPDNSADCIFAFDTLEHIHVDDRFELFVEMGRVLRKERRTIFINNPLNESQHDPNYDFELTEQDVKQLCQITGTRILETTILNAEHLHYQFIVLGSIIKPGVKP